MKRQNKIGQSGSVIVEMAIVLPVLLLLILGGIDLDLMITSKSSLNYVAGETARCMAHNATCDPSSFGATGTGLGLNGTFLHITPLTPNCPQNPLLPCTASARATYDWKPISPFFQPVTLITTAVAQQ